MWAHSITVILLLFTFANLTLGDTPNSIQLDPDSLKQLDLGLRKVFGFTEQEVISRRRRTVESETVIPQFMMDLANQEIENHYDSSTNDDFTFSGSIRSYHPTDLDFKEVAESHERHMKFNLALFPTDEVLASAELKVFSQAVDPFGNATHVSFSIYEIEPNRENNECSSENLRFLESREIHTMTKSKWNSFDVTSSVGPWISNPSLPNCGFFVTIRSDNDFHSFEHIKLKMNNNSVESIPEWLKHYEPILILKSRHKSQISQSDQQKRSQEVKRTSVKSEQASLRSRRSVIQGVNGNSEKSRRLEAIRSQLCNRYLFYIDFSQIGWVDWVLAPPGFQAYICLGSCPFPLAHHVNSTNHAIVQTMINSFRPQVVGSSTCVPTELSSISLLFLDQTNTPVLRSYKDMVVQACGCR